MNSIMTTLETEVNRTLQNSELMHVSFEKIGTGSLWRAWNDAGLSRIDTPGAFVSLFDEIRRIDDLQLRFSYWWDNK